MTNPLNDEVIDKAVVEILDLQLLKDKNRGDRLWQILESAGVENLKEAIAKVIDSALAGDRRDAIALLDGNIRQVLLDVANGIDSPASVAMASRAVVQLDKFCAAIKGKSHE